MTARKRFCRLCLLGGLAVLVAALFAPARTAAQEEVASTLTRFMVHEVSTGYYEQYEVLPQRNLPLMRVPGVARKVFPYSPTAASVRERTRLVDSHLGLKFYNNLRCEACHVQEALDIHTTRAKLTCRQCHGGEPISGSEHYYSPMNPIRRHAYVCDKCHPGSTASFAGYVVHEPAPGSATAKTVFSSLYYAYWFMLLLLAVTLAFFVPHTFLVGLREIFRRKGKGKDADDAH